MSGTSIIGAGTWRGDALSLRTTPYPRFSACPKNRTNFELHKEKPFGQGACLVWVAPVVDNDKINGDLLVPYLDAALFVDVVNGGLVY